MMSVEEAREAILARFHALDGEHVPVPQALGRVLARDVDAPEDLPPFANSAMDGYALRAADIAAADDAHPVRLTLIGEVPAGSVFPGTVGAGEAVRILTGAPLPSGADAVIQQELTTPGAGTVAILAYGAAGNNVRGAGTDVPQGSRLLARGTELGAAELAVLAAFELDPAPVTRRPRVAILATGDELAAPGERPRPGQIRDSNSVWLAAAVAQAGAEPWPLGIARDTADDLRAHLARAAEADLIITSGGVSVGTYDLVKDVLAEGGAVEFWRVRLRPGKPLAFGTYGATPLFGLPGNPVSSAVTFELFARPAIRTMLGAAEIDRPLLEVELAGEPIARGDRRHYVRARLTARDGRLIGTPTGEQGSHRIASLLGAGALLVIHEGEGMVAPGTLVPALSLSGRALAAAR
ncbi:MAG TPA: gephyrin-like molybdotransferase Glp [Ktedonobacterales bacterium]|nr:gephyrin-like molybdotransferase Glp [Ktedonobacterales bacterium]